MKTHKLSYIAVTLGLALQGPDAEVKGVNTLESAGPDELSFLSNPRYTSQLATTKAAAVIVLPEFATEVKSALISPHPYEDFGRVLGLFAETQGSFSGISPMAHIDPTAILEEGVTVYPFAYVGARARIGCKATLFPGVYVGEDSTVGAGTVMYPNAVIMSGTQVGEHCILHPGSVLGADGFGFARTATGIQKIPQVGHVVVGNHVEVGANTTIDRAVLDKTMVGNGTKIDNLVQIGHNVHMGSHCFIVSQVGISGSTVIGDNCTLAGQSGVAGHLRIGNNVTLGPQSGVTKNIPDNLTMGGTPAVDQSTFMRTLALMPRFPELFKRLASVEKTLEKLTSSHDRNDA